MTDEQKEGYRDHMAHARKSMVCECGSYCRPGRDTCGESECERSAAVQSDIENAKAILVEVQAKGGGPGGKLTGMKAAREYLDSAIECWEGRNKKTV